MIDTIKAYLETQDLGKLSNHTVVKETEDYQVYNVDGHLFYVKHSEGVISKISFKFSLHKLVKGNNAVQSDHLTIKRGLLLLKRMTGLPMEDFKITQLDIAVNVLYSGNHSEILDRFEYLPNYKRLSRPDWATSIAFQTKANKNKLKFYSKREEAKENPRRHKNIPILQDLIRIEYSQKHDINRGFGVTRLADLLKPDLMDKLTKKLKDVYNRVNKQKVPIFENITTDREFTDFILMLGIAKFGGMEQIKTSIDLLHEQKIINRKKSVISQMQTANKSKVNTIDSGLREFEIQFYKELGKLTKLNDEALYE